MDEHFPQNRRRNAVWILEEVSAELNSARELDGVITIVLDTLADCFDVWHASVFLRDDESAPRGAEQARPAPATRWQNSPKLRLAGSRGVEGRDQRRAAGRDLEVGRGIVGTAAAKQRVVRLNVRRKVEQPAGGDYVESRMAVPMLAKGSLMGVLALETMDHRLLGQADEQLVTLVANQAAVAIQNAQLNQHLENLNRELETRVAQRTAELETRHRELQEAQMLLLQSGKMAAIGELAAGLTHEMNTPLGAIKASVDVAKRALTMLGGDAAREKKARGALDQSHQLIHEACERVFSIFATLRRFIHLDESALRWVSLHDGLDSAVQLLAHRISDRVQVVRRYAELPPVCCYAGEINQVFLTVLTNALDALDAKEEDAEGPTLTLSSQSTDAGVVVEIRDNGVGIADEHMQRIFDPGFSTKGMRVGTGLSLAIAFRIMERHGGQIAIEGKLGQGTCVSLQLPVEQP